MTREPAPKPAGSDEIILPLTSLAHLFNAPAVSPFSPSAPEILGISGVEYLLPLLHMDKKRLRARTLVIALPPDQAAAAQGEQTTLALRRYAEARLARDARELRNTYYTGWRITAIALIALAICLALSSLFASRYTEFLRPLIRHTFEYGFEIVGWVIMWNPIDMLVFTPLPIRYRMADLRALGSMHVVICSDEAAASRA